MLEKHRDPEHNTSQYWKLTIAQAVSDLSMTDGVDLSVLTGKHMAHHLQ